MTLLPACTVDADCNGGDGCVVDSCVDSVCQCAAIDCDDLDPCTVDACADGACTNEPLDCDDGNDCTVDICSNGFCIGQLDVDLPTVEQVINDALAALEASPCADEELVKKIRRKIAKKLKKALKTLSKTDDVTKERKLSKLFLKADKVLAKAQLIVAALRDRGAISPACATTLQAMIGQLQFCSSGLPRPL